MIIDMENLNETLKLLRDERNTLLVERDAARDRVKRLQAACDSARFEIDHLKMDRDQWKDEVRRHLLKSGQLHPLAEPWKTKPDPLRDFEKTDPARTMTEPDDESESPDLPIDEVKSLRAEVERLKAERVKTLAAIDHILEITIKEHLEINSIMAGAVRFSEAVERLKAEIHDRVRPTKPA